MKRIIFIILPIAFSIALSYEAMSAPKPLPIGFRFGFFYTSLSPHGEWIEIEPGFHIWRPFHISHRWRPYLIGRWVWTDYGWYWMSREPFGWITYHYGRWYYDNYYGWVWVPDDVWGPAWVEWRYTDDYIGWAPLPPYAVFRIGIGISFTTHWVAPPHYWNFVRYHHFGSVIRYRDTAPEEYTRRIIRTSRSGNQYEFNRDRIINRGVDREIIERRGSLRIPRAEIQESSQQHGERIVRANDNRGTTSIEIYRPSQDEIQRSAERFQPKRGERPLSLDINKIDRSGETRQKLNDRNRDDNIRPNEQRGERKIRPEEQPREYIPRREAPKKQQDQQERRRELLQRHDSEPKPVPPATRETQRQNIERKRDKNPTPPQGNRNIERGSERQKERSR